MDHWFMASPEVKEAAVDGSNEQRKPGVERKSSGLGLANFRRAAFRGRSPTMSTMHQSRSDNVRSFVRASHTVDLGCNIDSAHECGAPYRHMTPSILPMVSCGKPMKPFLVLEVVFELWSVGTSSNLCCLWLWLHLLCKLFSRCHCIINHLSLRCYSIQQ